MNTLKIHGQYICPTIAFANAIERGLLTDNKSYDNYAGNYMYMYTEKEVDYFKNIVTREYISCTSFKG